MHRGFVKLWRKAKESGIIREHKTWILWTYLLLSVTHKKIKVTAGREKIELLPGQIISGRNRLARETGLSVQGVRTVLNNLKSTNRITIKSTNRYSIITVVNWKAYQGNSDHDPPADYPKAQPMPNQQLTTKQEHKNIRIKKKPASGSVFNLMDTLAEQVHGICFGRRIRFNPKQWVMVQTRNNVHPGAIIEALESMVANADTVEDFWAWGDQIVKVKSGNYHEADTQAQSTGHKQDLVDLIATIGGKQ